MHSTASPGMSPVDVSLWIGAVVVAPGGAVEGKIDDAVIDAATGKVRYFVVAISDPLPGRARVFALPIGDCSFDENSLTCVAESLYPLQV